MYLSRATMRQTPEVAKEFLSLKSSGAYATHQMIWKLFEHESNKRNFLYREDVLPSGLTEYLILSTSEPLINSLLFSIESKRYSPLLETGSRLAFRLRVNPTIGTTDEAGKKKRHDVLMHAKYLAKKNNEKETDVINDAMNLAAKKWISNEKRLASWGVSMDSAPEVEAYVQHRTQKNRNVHIRFSSVDYQGLLTVQEPATFLSRLYSGFGHAKGFGCGLMLIKRAG